MTFLAVSAVRKWALRKSGDISSMNPADVPGVSPGETVVLPELRDIDGKPFSISEVKDDYLLCVVFTTACPGCARDSEMWADINSEAAKHHVGLYIMSSDDDGPRVQRFARAYGFADLKVLYDPNRQLARALKISFVPQYILMTSRGRVIARWNGVQNYDSHKPDKSKIDKLFAPLANN